MKLTRLGMAGALAATLGLGGCASMSSTPGRAPQTWTLNTSDRAPAAQGQVKVQAQKNGNTGLKVEVEHLAPPASVNQDASTYVVWLRPAAGFPQNIGVLNLNDKHEGKLSTQTPFKSFEVTVTAEMTPYATAPSGDRVMTAQVVVPT
jgi:hypothetical protein